MQFIGQKRMTFFCFKQHPGFPGYSDTLAAMAIPKPFVNKNPSLRQNIDLSDIFITNFSPLQVKTLCDK